MDKTLIFALATAFTASLFAETTYISGTGFEPLAAGADVLNSSDMKTGDASHSYSSLWKFASTGDRSTSLTITTYSDAAKSTVAVPDDDDAANYPKYRTSSGDNEKYLRVDSGSDVLSRYVGPYTGDEDVVDISGNGGIYMDTMVQFTATDTSPTPDSADKLLVWLYAPPEDPSSTNLMVTAGAYSDGSYSSSAVKYTVSNVEILEREWHRLTIVAEMFSYGTSSSTARFKVYIDRIQLVADDGTSKFPSLIAYNLANFETLKTLNFNGEGAVDDVVFGAGNPFPPESLAYKIILGEGVTGFSYSVGGVDMGEAEIEDGKFEFVFTDVDSIGKTFTITDVFYADGYQADPASARSGIIAEDGGFTITALKTGFTVVVNNGEPQACASLAAVNSAISSASSAIITLNSDYTLATSSETLKAITSMVLDLNGNTLQATNAVTMITVSKDKSLVVRDSVGTGAIKFADGVDAEGGSPKRYLINNVAGTLTIGENVSDTFILDNGRVRTYNGTLYIKGGKFAKVPYNGSTEIEDFTGICPTGYTLAKADGDEYYTLQEAGDDETTEVSADDVASTQYDTEEAANAAAAGVTIVAPNNASLNEDEKAAYSGYVTTAVVESDGKFVVNAVFTAEKEGELQEVADEAAAAALAASADGKIEVSAVPGLYYALDHGTALPLEESEPTLAPAGAEKVEFTVEKDAEQGFYRVRISPTK